MEHFIDSTGIISWRFFSDKYDYDFKHWDFSGSNEQECNTLFAILAKQGKEVYVTEFNDLGASACRILVPNYSEIYPIEDLIWNNTNMALDFREDILNIHRLSDNALEYLMQRLEQSQLDNYMDISTLIGIVFDENTTWGQLTILEVKILIYLALKQQQLAIDLVEEFLQYNENTVERNLFYQAIHAVLTVSLDDDLQLKHYLHNFNRMYGVKTMENVVGSVNGTVKFHGLTETSMKLEGLEKHLKLIESYKKLHFARAHSKSF